MRFPFARRANEKRKVAKWPDLNSHLEFGLDSA